MPDTATAIHRAGDSRIPRLAVFGAYSDDDLYQRNRILVETLQALADDVVLIRPRYTAPTHGFAASLGPFKRLRTMAKEGLSLLRQLGRLRGDDLVFVPYPAYLPVLLLWLSGRLRRRRLIVDAFLDLYGTVVEDRGLVPARSLRAYALLRFQRMILRRADLILIDTQEHGEMLRRRIGDEAPEIAPVPVGIDERQWLPLPQAEPDGRCKLLFWGTFIPLHGIPTILEALRILEQRNVPVDCTLIGDGQVAPGVAQSLAVSPLVSLHWERRLLDTEALRGAVEGADIVLGIFGASEKAASVVPYKVHQGLASDRALVTRASPVLEALADAERGLVLVPPEDPVALADAVETLWARLQAGWTPSTRTIFDRSCGRAAVLAALTRAVATLPDHR